LTRVFISYKRVDPDRQFASQLRTWLLQQGFQAWMDVHDIPSGANWDEAIDKALDAADVVVGIISPDSIESENVKNEWMYAREYGRLHLLLYRSHLGMEIPHTFSRVNYIDFSGKDPDCWQKLRDTLHQIGVEVGRPPSSRPVTPPVSPKPIYTNPVKPQKPKSSGLMQLIRNRILLVGAGIGVTVLVCIVLLVGLASLANNSDNNTNSNSALSAANAENFVIQFYSGNIEAALRFVCPRSQVFTRTTFSNILITLASQGVDLRATNISCQAGSGTVSCSYFEVFSNGASQPVSWTYPTENNLVCFGG
jgi:hypothetical protein